MPKAQHKFLAGDDTASDEVLEISLEDEYNAMDALAVPPMPDDDRYVYRWIRYRSGNEEDYSSINFRMREGWRFVKVEEIPPEFVFPSLGSNISALEGCVLNGDLVLAKLPRRRADAIKKLAEDRANMAERAYDMQTIQAEDSTGQARALINQGSRSVTRGRRPSFG